MQPADPDYLVIVGAICLIIAILIIAVIIYLRQQQKAKATKETGAKNERLNYHPQVRPIPPVPKSSIPRPVTKPETLPPVKETSILNGRNDITESLQALTEKYSLEQFTIATSDGLVFASSGGENAQTDAARYSEIFVHDPLSETPGVVLSGLSFKGSDLILVIRTPLAVPDQVQEKIVNDTKDILNWWI